MRGEPHRDASSRADTDQVDAFQWRSTVAVQQRPPGEPVLHHHESARRKLALEHVPDPLIRRRGGAPRHRDGGEQRSVVRHVATSFTTRSRSDAATGASGGRTGPPYNPPPTASMAAFTPAGPSFPTTSRSSGASRSWSLDRKSTRLNSSPVSISYAVFCLKKKKRSIFLSFLHPKKHQLID